MTILCKNKVFTHNKRISPWYIQSLETCPASIGATHMEDDKYDHIDESVILTPSQYASYMMDIKKKNQSMGLPVQL